MALFTQEKITVGKMHYDLATMKSSDLRFAYVGEEYFLQLERGDVLTSNHATHEIEADLANCHGWFPYKADNNEVHLLTVQQGKVISSQPLSQWAKMKNVCVGSVLSKLCLKLSDDNVYSELALYQQCLLSLKIIDETGKQIAGTEHSKKTQVQSHTAEEVKKCKRLPPKNDTSKYAAVLLCDAMMHLEDESMSFLFDYTTQF